MPKGIRKESGLPELKLHGRSKTELTIAGMRSKEFEDEILD